MKSKYIKFISLSIVVFLLAIALVMVQNRVASQAKLLPTNKIKFKGKIIADKDISAIGLVDKYIIIGADEGSKIQVLKPNKKRSKYKVIRNIELLSKEGKSEVDIEGITVFDNTVCVVGSHSKKSNLDKNSRSNVFRFKLNPDTGKLESTIEKTSLQKILLQDKVLNRFTDVAHNKNGVDIEGIAIKSDRLYFGFRTPILENNYVPVVVVKFKDINRIDNYQLHYINLGGGGIRDLVAVDNGFLLLTDGKDSKNNYQVYFWDGSDRLAKQNTRSTVRFLDDIPTPKNTRAEGLTILQETDSNYRILVVYDGVAKGNPTIFEIQK